MSQLGLRRWTPVYIYKPPISSRKQSSQYNQGHLGYSKQPVQLYKEGRNFPLFLREQACFWLARLRHRGCDGAKIWEGHRSVRKKI